MFLFFVFLSSVVDVMAACAPGAQQEDEGLTAGTVRVREIF